MSLSQMSDVLGISWLQSAGDLGQSLVSKEMVTPETRCKSKVEERHERVDSY